MPGLLSLVICAPIILRDHAPWSFYQDHDDVVIVEKMAAAATATKLGNNNNSTSDTRSAVILQPTTNSTIEEFNFEPDVSTLYNQKHVFLDSSPKINKSIHHHHTSHNNSKIHKIVNELKRKNKSISRYGMKICFLK